MNQRIATSCVCCGSKDLKKSPAILMPFISHRVFGWEPIEIDDSWGLKTINNGMAYSICNSALCSHCFHLFLDLRFNDYEMGLLYGEYRGEAYVNLREKYEPGYKSKNDKLSKGYNYIKDIEAFLEPFLKDSLKILDWGGDTGKNTPFRESCDLLHIYDISKMPVIGKAKIVDKNEIGDTNYDLIVCSNVLEHVPFPKTILSDIRLAMNKKSILYLELPYENLIRTTKSNLELHRIKKHWHEHINFFTHKSLEAILLGSNFQIMALRTLHITEETADYVFQLCCKLK